MQTSNTTRPLSLELPFAPCTFRAYRRHNRKLARNEVLGEERPTRPMEKVFAWRPCRFVRSGQRATITGIRNGGGFPNRRRKFLGKLALILQDLFPLPSCDGPRFR